MSIPFKPGTTTTMDEIRCVTCGKLLGYIDGNYKIKCSRCKEMNTKKESVGNDTVENLPS